MRYNNAWLILLACSLVTCQRDEELGQPKQLAIVEAKAYIATARNENNLITKVDLIAGSYIVSFEQGSSISFSTNVLQSLEYDSSNWLATFTFLDHSMQHAPFLGKLQIDTTQVIQNPFLSSPLSALAKIQTPVSGKFKVVVHGKGGAGIAIEKMFDSYGTNHELQILGLYENYRNNIEFIFLNENDKIRCSKTISIKVPVIPKKPDLNFQVLNNQLPAIYNGLYIVFSHKMGFDQAGELRWYYSGEGSNFYTKLGNGNFISSTFDNKYFYEVSMLGQIVKKYSVPQRLHHEIIEMPSGNFLVASHSPPGPPYEDVVVEIDRTSGEVIKFWDFNLILDPLRLTLPDTQTGDWLHINAMYYDETDNSIVISGRSQSAVVKIDYVTGNIKWLLGPHEYWGESFQQFLLTPVDGNGNEIDVSNTDFWNYGQHAIQKTVNGNVLMYDNGDYREYYKDPNVQQTSYTRLVEYKINVKLKTVQLLWEFDGDKKYFTMYTGYAQDLPDTHTRLAAFMWVTENTPKIMELDATGNVLLEASLRHLNSIYYRAYKEDIYRGIK